MSASRVIELLSDGEEEQDQELLDQQQHVPEDSVRTLQEMLGGVSAARCKSLLLGAGLDIDRAINHHFDQQEEAAAPAPVPAPTPAAAPKPKAKPRAKAPAKAPAAKPAAAPRVSPLVAKSPAAKKPLSSLFDTQIAGIKSMVGSLFSASSSSPADSPAAAASSSSSSSPAAAAASSSRASSFAPDFMTASDYSLDGGRSRLSRAARPTSFKKKPKKRSAKGSDEDGAQPKKKKQKKSSDDESAESDEDEEASDQEESEASDFDEDASDSDASEDEASDDEMFGAAPFRRRAPFGRPARSRGGLAALAAAAAPRPAAPRPAAAAAAKPKPAGKAAAAAAAAAEALLAERIRRAEEEAEEAAAGFAFGRRRRGGGGARRAGRGGRANAAALKAENARLITPAVLAQQEEDEDETRLALVQTWARPPPAIDPIAAGLRFPEKLAERARWRPGVLIDCNLLDGRGWEKAKIVNVVSAPRSFALSYDVTFEERRIDITPGAIFRFSAMDLSRLSVVDVHDNYPRFTVAEHEEDKVQERAKKKAQKNNTEADAEAEERMWTVADFRLRQIIDVRVGERWFLGSVSDSKFTVTPEGGYADIIEVQLLDFHVDCTRRFVKAQFDQLHPVAYSHTITHYPLAAMPNVREKEFGITSVYAGRAPGFNWSTENGSVALEDEPEEKKEVKEEELALDSPAAASSASARPAAAGPFAAAAAASAAAAAAAAAPTPIRPLGRFELTIVTDASFNPAEHKIAGVKNAKSLLERAVPCHADDPLCTKMDGEPLSREVALQRLLLTMDYNRGNVHTFIYTEIEVDLVQVGAPEDGSAKPSVARGVKHAPATAKQKALERDYRATIEAELWTSSMVSDPINMHNLRMRQLKGKLNSIEKKRVEARKKAVKDGLIKDADDGAFEVSEDDEPKPKARAAASSRTSKTSISALAAAATAAMSGKKKAVQDARVKLDLGESLTVEEKHDANSLIDEHGSLRWYRLRVQFKLIRTAAKDPKKTSQEVTPLNELMLLLFPHDEPLHSLSRAAVKPMPSYLPQSLQLDGLLKHSAHYHHTLGADEAKAKHDAEEAEAKRDAGADEEMKDGGGAEAAPAAAANGHAADEADWKKMNAEQLSRAAHLIPVCTLKDYQVQTVQWILHAESPGSNVSQPFWATLKMEDGTAFQYSPFLQRFAFSPHPNIAGGLIAEEMGLGKTIEMLAVLNIKAADDAESAARETAIARGLAAAANGAAPASSSAAAASRQAPVRDAHGAFITRATLIICPVSLISQWIAELREKSERPLKILSYHGTRPKRPEDLVDYDVVISAYSILSKESSLIATRAKHAALFTPWAYNGKAGLEYSSPLGQVHWRRVILDEGQSVKNASAECSQQANKLLGRCRYLMSGTPFGTSLMDLKGQTRFLGVTGFGGTVLFGSLYRFMQSQSRYAELAKRIHENDYEGTPYRIHEWLKRFRNIFTWLVTRCMIRHEKSMVFRGRDTLLVLPDARVEVVRVELTPRQRAAYKLLYEFACKRFAAFKESGDAVRKTIEVLQLLVPLRQACSVDSVDIDSVRRQLRDIARGIVIGPVVGAASAPSEAFPQAKSFAFGTLADECTICLDVLEDAVQTRCNHLFCKDCISALCMARGADSTCPNCRQSVQAGGLFAPLIKESDEDREAREEKEEKDAALAAAAAAAAEDAEMAAAAAPAAAKKKPAAKKNQRKRKRKNNSDDEEEEDQSDSDFEERKSGGDDDDAEKEAEAEEEVTGTVVFDSKLKALISELEAMKVADPEAKALVFTQFRNSMDKIQEALKQADIKFETLQGHYTLPQRKKALERFKSDPDTTVFLLSVRAAAAGLTLVSASYVFIVEAGFNPAVTLQAINRVWRMGQQKQVNVRYLVVSDTVEETILVIAREKMAKRGAGGDDQSDHSGGANLSLLPELKDSHAAASGLAAAESAAAAAAAPLPPSPPPRNDSSSDEEMLDARSERARLLGRISRAGRNGRNSEENRGAGRGVVMGHATADAPDLRLGELERLFAV